MFTAIFGIVSVFAIVCVTVWWFDQIEHYMEHHNNEEKITVFEA